MLGVIECKDWENKVGTPELDAFITKTRDINANLRLMVSPKGFTEPALAQAKDAGVGVFSLLPHDPNEAGFSVGLLWYGREFGWEHFQSRVTFSGEQPKPGYLHAEILFDGHPVINALFWQLSTTHLQYTGGVALMLRLNSARWGIPVTVRGDLFRLLGFNLFAARKFKRKKRFMQVTGDALYDWEAKKALFPKEGGSFSIHNVTHDLSDWDDYEGKFPQLADFQFIINSYRGCIDLEKEGVPEITNCKIAVEQIPPQLDIT